ncbi:hypothetical protein [Haloplanus pelagicus]|uniref:hypothetical protein n=1 Tax=Haloplanus pelagicus TaxID=2949995 RepID=UPI00203A5A0A|nr:hypothetical protein [Haloplanus sp. HW8-1]
MVQTEGAVERLRRRKSMESDLREQIGGVQFSLPLFTIEQAQEIRLRPDYEDLLFDMYMSPQKSDLDFEHDTLSYRIKDVEVREHGTGISYRVKRILDMASFQAIVKIDLEFEESIPTMQLHEDPRLEDLDLSADYYRGDSEMTLWMKEVEDGTDALAHLAQFNQALSSQWNGPKTIDEAIEGIAKWQAFNLMQEKRR